MSLHIARIEIENFRNFGKLVIDPFPATAVIVGQNNVGKSNLLFALRLVLDPDLPDSVRRLRAEDIFDGSGGFPQAVTVRIAVELAGFEDDSRASAALVDCFTADEPLRARIEYRFEPRMPVDGTGVNQTDTGVSGHDLTAADYDWRILGGPEDQARPVRSEPRRYIGVRVLPALRDASDELTRRRSPLRDLLDRIKPDPEILQGAVGDVNSAVELLLTDEAISGLQTSLRDQTIDMVGPALEVSPTLGITPAAPDQLLRQIRLFTDSNKRRGLGDTSVGTANVLYLALLLEAVKQRRISREHVTTILGVEEPEAHLHVQVQRRLFGYLLRQEPALLLTSHSPHIAAVAPLPSLVLLRATENGSIATTTARANITQQEQDDLERYLDATRAELLFAKLALLVEGDAERYVIPALAKAAKFDLDEYGVSVISVQGTDFGPFRRLLGKDGLDIPHSVLTDGDRSLDPHPATSDGLARALSLMESDIARRALDAFPVHPRRDGHLALDPELEREARRELCRNGIFVGDITLEIDLARCLPGPFSGAIKDLLGSRAATEQLDCLEKIRQSKDDIDVRKAFLKRIEAIGKGRFAQRLASHLAEEDLTPLQGMLDPVSPIGYALQVLDDASRRMRGRPLLESNEDTNGQDRAEALC
ncbi:ATP-dependent nuclease [Nonomuraea indica]|uniref:ATP-dependent nuclease n=1 Tax=Nonomuraea indica TaxID=1581193 RepID=A0ABW7ZVY2_9ACTN